MNNAINSHIEKVLNWLEPLSKKSIDFISNLRVNQDTQKTISNSIVFISAQLEKNDKYFSDRLLTIGKNLFYIREISNSNYTTHQSPLVTNEKYFFYTPYPTIIPTVIKEKIFFINLSMFGRLHEVLLYIKNEASYRSQWLNMHPEIIKISREKFLDGHYADAVESAFKYINLYIKNIFQSFKPEDTHTDGSQLMCNVFSKENPKIILSDVSTETGQNIQMKNAKINKNS